MELWIAPFEHVCFNKQRDHKDNWLCKFGGKYKQEVLFSDGAEPSHLTYKAWVLNANIITH
ncbi:MAG: hypothetical protein EBS24_07080 [Chitinophagia bacterium]|nr:hypothetical protein [Chitinophagia bacterium]